MGRGGRLGLPTQGARIGWEGAGDGGWGTCAQEEGCRKRKVWEGGWSGCVWEEEWSGRWAKASLGEGAVERDRLLGMGG
jgi:hypothetical protein